MLCSVVVCSIFSLQRQKRNDNYSFVHLQLLQSSSGFQHKRLTEEDDYDNGIIGAGNIQVTEAQLNLSQSENNETIHSVVLDMAPVTFIDSAGANTIKYVCDFYHVCP